jgi:3-hydroxy acid dehydrogenase/malonic semialdehyde reductase
MAPADYRTALITGATSGIGAAVARALVARGLTVHAAARRRERLEALAAATGCLAHVVDVRDRAAVHATFTDLEIDILINSAGIGLGFAGLHAAAPEDIEATLETNVLGTAQVLRAVLPGMVERGRGHVVNIGSIFGLHAIGSSVYGASKGAVHLMSQNLRLELAGTGLRVTEVCPGRTHTEFLQIAAGDPERARDMVSGFDIITAEDVCAAVLFALDAPWHVNISLIELTATEQIPGGSQIVPVARGKR